MRSNADIGQFSFCELVVPHGDGDVLRLVCRVFLVELLENGHEQIPHSLPRVVRHLGAPVNARTTFKVRPSTFTPKYTVPPGENVITTPTSSPLLPKLPKMRPSAHTEDLISLSTQCITVQLVCAGFSFYKNELLLRDVLL